MSSSESEQVGPQKVVAGFAEAIIRRLIRAADEVRKNAYAPYSGYQVGAALMTKSGLVFSGCNVENASYGLTNCAERSAIFTAVGEGHREFVAIAVVTDQGWSPCGACRQVIREFGADIIVIIADGKGNFSTTTSGALLPSGFSAADMT
ncbi:MAG: cytidine deaminase [Anaerolineae bacterium]|nr:cytidine deaminase [Anaerolineae bacterium]